MMKKPVLLFLISLICGYCHPQNFWQQAPAPTGGCIRSFLQDPGGRIFTGTNGGGIYYSDDNGTSWEGITSSYSPDIVFSFALNSAGQLFAAGDSRIYRSDDHGLTWSVCFNVLGYVFSITITENGALLAGTEYGVYRSMDHGLTWQPLWLVFPQIPVVALYTNPDNNIFAGTMGAGILRSADDGNTWVLANEGLTSLSIYSFTCSDSNFMFAGTYGNGVFRSKNNGDQWMAVNNGINPGNIYALISSPDGNLYASSNGVYRSENHGNSWEMVCDSVVSFSITALTNGSVLAGTCPDGVIRSTDGGTSWTFTNHGLFNVEIRSILSEPSGELFIGTHKHGIYYSPDNGSNWYQRNEGLFDYKASYIADLVTDTSGRIYAATFGSNVFISNDHGQNWSQSGIGLQCNQVLSIAVNHAGHIYAGTVTDVYCSKDQGLNWEVCSALVHTGNLYAYDITFNSSDHIFVATSAGIYISADNGISWTVSHVPALNDYHYAILTDSSDRLYVGGIYSGIFCSDDNGQTWYNTCPGVYMGQTYSLCFDKNHGLYAGGLTGVKYSGDHGAHWTDLNQGLYEGPVLGTNYVNVIHATSGGSLFCGTNEHGLYMHNSDPSSIDHAAMTFVHAILYPSFPNPFSEVTYIRYYLPCPGRVRLDVYNVMGQLTTILVNEEQGRGFHMVQWNGTGQDGRPLPSGVCLYKLDFQDRVMTKKALIKR